MAFGVAKEYIAWLRSHACVKRKPPSEYRKIPIHALHQSGARNLNITSDELAKFDGSTIIPDEHILEQAAILQQQALHGGGAACATAASPSSPAAAAAISAAATAAAAAAVATPGAAAGSLPPLPTVSATAAPAAAASSSSLAPPPPPVAFAVAGDASPSPNSSASPSPTASASPSPSDSPSHPARYHPLRIAVNKKVLEWIGDLSQPLLANTYEFMRFNFGGTDLTHSYTRVFFEPLYPIVDSFKDMSLEHRAMIEDIFYEKVLGPDEASREWKLVGFLSNEEQRNSQQAGRAKLRKNHRGSMDQLQSDAGSGSGSVAVESGEGNMQIPENLFLSLSLEDHSGAGSSCFAFCCAGAQPFHQQARALRFRSSAAAGAGGRHGGVGVGVGSGGGGVGRGSGEAVGAPSELGSSVASLSAAASNAAEAFLAKAPSKIHQADRKRRHSIGNVGLHALTMGTTAASASASTSASASAAASVSAASAGQCCGSARSGTGSGACSSPSCNAADAIGNAAASADSAASSSSSSSSSTAAAASSTAASSSSSTAAAALVSPLPHVGVPRPFLTRPHRSASICTGMLAAYHSAQLAQGLMSPTSDTGTDGSSFAQSPRRRINSADGLISPLASPLGINVAAAAAAAAANITSPSAASASAAAAAAPSWPLVCSESPYGEEQCLAAMPSPVNQRVV